MSEHQSESGSGPSPEEMRRAHLCMTALRASFIQSLRPELGGAKAMVRVSDLLAVIDRFVLGKDSFNPSDLQGPFFPGAH